MALGAATIGMVANVVRIELATASGDGTVRLWDVATGKETAALSGHTSRVLGSEPHIFMTVPLADYLLGL